MDDAPALELAVLEAMLLPEPDPGAPGAHGEVPVPERGVRLGWILDLLDAVAGEIERPWTRYGEHERAYEHLNFHGTIPEPVRPAIPQGQALTPHFLVEAVVRPLTSRCRSALFDRVPPEAVGPPAAFVSHSWANPLAGSGGTLPQFLADGRGTFQARAGDDLRAVPVWLDILVYDQHRPQSVAGDMEAVVGSIGTLVLALGTPNTFSRLWCLWEWLCAQAARADVVVLEPDWTGAHGYFGTAREQLDRAFTSIADARTGVAADREQILAAMEARFGSIAAADEVLLETIRSQLTTRDDAPWNRPRAEGDG